METAVHASGSGTLSGGLGGSGEVMKANGGRGIEIEPIEIGRVARE
jgi:hypothetical protein